VYQITLRLLTGDHFSQLLERKCCGWMSRDIEVSNAPTSDLHDKKDVEEPKLDGRYDEEITSQDRLGMIVNKGHPALR
jgi:hypothetical protein